MACCLIAAFLIAQALETLRRWGMFWGLVPVPAGEQVDTAFSRVARWAARPRVRAGIGAVVALELVAVASWAYVEHGVHAMQIADIAWSRLHGQTVVYADTCGDPSKAVRLVLNDIHSRSAPVS